MVQWIVIQVALSVQNLSAVVAVVFLFLLFPFAEQPGEDPDMRRSPFTGWLFVVYYSCLVVLNATSEVFSMAELVSVERDWVVALTRGDKKLLAGTMCVCVCVCVW